MLAIGGKLTAKAARAAGRAASQAEADARAAELQAAGCVSLRAIADGLDARGIPTAKGAFAGAHRPFRRKRGSRVKRGR